jgi:glutaredoxin
MCGYCSVLKRDLDRIGVSYTEIDIWEQRDKAAVVRDVTGGDEIVPTVQVGDRFFVNPTAREVVEAAKAA